MPAVRAPGRVNLIGDHTDYQDGFCLPMAIDRSVDVVWQPNEDARVRARSDALAGTVDVAADGSADPRGVHPAWGGVVAAVVRVLGELGRAAVGFDAEITSTVPVGAGLSSSAAIEVALTLVAAAAAAFPIEPLDVARTAQTIEHVASGVPCGIMDQMACVFGQADHALLLDCRSLAVSAIRIPDDVAVIVAHSGEPRRLADSAYADRRHACDRAAARLGLDTLRDATLADVGDDPFARHVVSENARVFAFAEALAAHDLTHAGAVMLASHASLRDDFGVSTPALDALVQRLVGAGAYGARLTGAGFGGCAVALVDVGRVDTVVGALTTPHWVVRAVEGAHAID